ncbi:ROK family transcriptional regulator [Brachybacterium sp. YJGR34]|uniref:ROK family transcriptional regulator n=1 Tax=Brachybacterium sp. YJGR34 TaxID=2059911 RepID=UPI000E0C41FC|nr:ROK family transcriptional regulator [Brachybacterium sp. YJGR34]
MSGQTARSGGTSGPTWPELGPVHRATLRAVLVGGPSSRAEIARDLGLSRASLTRVTRELVDWGLLVEGHMERRGTTGRPGEMLHARQDAWRFLGVKLTGDRLYAVVTDLGARVLVEVDEPLRSREVEDVIAQISVVRTRLEDGRSPVVGVGVALGGDVRTVPGGGAMIDSPFHGWRDVPLARRLEEELDLPVQIENDVRCLTAAEHLFGVGVGLDSLVLLTIGVGLGVGAIVAGQLVTGAQGAAGRLDHLPLSGDGPVCDYCGRVCPSASLTSGAMVQSLDRPGTDYDGLLTLARAGDADALRVVRGAARALGALVATLAATLDPQKVVITGDGIAVTALAREELDASIAAHAHPAAAPVPLEIAPFAFDEWARAAAVLAIRARIED